MFILIFDQFWNVFLSVHPTDMSSSVSVPDDKWLSTLESTRWLDYTRYICAWIEIVIF